MTAWRESPAVKQGIAVGIATGTYGISFGALAVAAGLSVPQACALSALMFTGGSQFAFIGVIGGGGSGIAAIATAALLGIRNGIYGLQLSPLFRGWRRLPAAQLTIDESMAVSTAQQGEVEQRRGFWAAGLGVYLFWNLMTLVGALLGNVLPDPKQIGLDGAACAAFIGLLWPRLKTRDGAAVAVAAGFVAALFVPFTQPGIPVLAAAVASVVLGWFLTRNRAQLQDGDA